MIVVGQHLHALFGRKFEDNDFVALFSAHLDETGTDGNSPYTVVAGAVAIAPQWDKLEAAWRRMLDNAKVSAYHWKQFHDGHDDFVGWSEFKRKRFVEKQERIINRNTVFRVSVGVEGAAHAEVKQRMKGVKGFRPESDYSLCLRYLMFSTSEQLAKIDPDHRLSILVEDGPYASGAMETYQHVAAMTGKWKPAKHAHRLAGFASAPKGARLSLEAADYLAGEELTRMLRAKRSRRGAQTLSLLLTGQLLEQWYGGMVKEKAKRREYGRRKPKTDLPSRGASS